MNDVRHPLKARRLDEPTGFMWRSNYRPLEMVNPQKPELPETAKCAKCGEEVSMADRAHGCFKGWTWKGDRRR